MITAQDLARTTDLTGINPVTAADINNLIDLSEPAANHGFILLNKDSTLDTPASVPDASVTTKWKRYLWVRVPHLSAESHVPTIYSWNDDVDSDPVMLKWVDVSSDFTELQTQIQDALNTANNASATADSALVNANNAITLANNAIAELTDIGTKADNAIDTATTASSTATTAKETANTAKATADAALTKADAKRDVGAAITPGGTALQMLRTNADKTSVEWFSPINLRAKFSEQQNKGVNGGATIAGKNKRVLNTEEYDAGNLASNAGGDVTIAVAGVYHVRAWSVLHNNGNMLSQLVLAKNDDSVLLYGASLRSNLEAVGTVEGILTFAAGDVIRLNHYCDQDDGTYGLGFAVNINAKEVYAELHLTKLS